MNPQHSVSQSACILSLGTEIKNNTREQCILGCEIDFTRLWCCNKIGSECTQLGAGLLEEQCCKTIIRVPILKQEFGMLYIMLTMSTITQNVF